MWYYETGLVCVWNVLKVLFCLEVVFLIFFIPLWGIACSCCLLPSFAPRLPSGTLSPTTFCWIWTATSAWPTSAPASSSWRTGRYVFSFLFHHTAADASSSGPKQTNQSFADLLVNPPGVSQEECVVQLLGCACSLWFRQGEQKKSSPQVLHNRRTTAWNGWAEKCPSMSLQC